MNRPLRKRAGSPRRTRAGSRRWSRVLVGLAVAVATTYGWHIQREFVRAPHVPAEANTAATPSARQAPSRGAAGGVDYPGSVTQVADGDTVRFQTATGELRIRIDSIDAPERDAGPRRPGQPFASASQAHLQRWVKGRELVARCFEVDQYDRSVCDLIDANGESAARAQVQAGYAWAYTAAKGRYLRDDALVTLQAQARAAGRGLWQNRQVIPPWVWRYDCWRENKCSP